MKSIARAAGLLGLALSLTAPASAAHAEDPRLADVLVRLGAYSDRFETLKHNAAATFSAHIEKLSSDGTVSSTSDLEARSSARQGRKQTTVLRFIEDGKDKTEEAQEKARDRDKEKRKKESEFTLPFTPRQQPRYEFAIKEANGPEAARMRITFQPKDGLEAEDLYVGEAWVDGRAGTILTMGFRPTKLPSFMSEVTVKLEFGATTPIGPGVSTVAMDGEGGILFLRKRFRVHAVLRDYAFYF